MRCLWNSDVGCFLSTDHSLCLVIRQIFDAFSDGAVRDLSDPGEGQSTQCAVGEAVLLPVHPSKCLRACKFRRKPRSECHNRTNVLYVKWCWQSCKSSSELNEKSEHRSPDFEQSVVLVT